MTASIKIKNIYSGEIHLIDANAIQSLLNFYRARKLFLDFERARDSSNPDQADRYMLLLKLWEKTIKQVKPYVNFWYCCRYGNSLN